MEPRLATVEDQHRDVGEGAGAEAASDGQVHAIAEAPPLPLRVVEVARHGGIAVLDATAAAGLRADEKLAERARDMDAASIGALDDVPHGQRAAAGAWQSATPIMASRVTKAASFCSDMPSVPSGRIGRTM